MNGTPPEEYVIKAALLRSHLSDDQRAVLAARWQARESEKAQKAAGKKARAVQLGVSANASESPERDTRTEAARLFAVPERKVRYAAEVAKSAPELLDRVERGDIRFVALGISQRDCTIFLDNHVPAY